MDAELEKRPFGVDDVNETEDRIVSQWAEREVSADERHERRDKFDEILRPLGYETNLVVIRRANGLALYFICMTLAALMSLRDQWRSHQLRDTVQKLFTFLSGATDSSHETDSSGESDSSHETDFSDDTDTVRVERLTWPLTDYQRSLDFFSPVQSKQTI